MVFKLVILQITKVHDRDGLEAFLIYSFLLFLDFCSFLSILPLFMMLTYSFLLHLGTWLGRCFCFSLHSLYRVGVARLLENSKKQHPWPFHGSSNSKRTHKGSKYKTKQDAFLWATTKKTWWMKVGNICFSWLCWKSS